MNRAFRAIWSAFAGNCARPWKDSCVPERLRATAGLHLSEWTTRKSNCASSTRAKTRPSTLTSCSNRAAQKIGPAGSRARIGFWSLDDAARGSQEFCFIAFKGESAIRSEEHTSELQSHSDLVCR